MAGSGRLTSIEYFNSDKLFIKNESELEQENASGIFETRKYVVNHEMFFLGDESNRKNMDWWPFLQIEQRSPFLIENSNCIHPGAASKLYIFITNGKD